MNKEQENYKLDKEIKVRQYFFLGFGCIIGVGWVVYLGNWLKEAGPLGALLAFGGGRNALAPVINVGSSCFALAYLLTCLGIIKLRISRPGGSTGQTGLRGES